MCVFLSVCVSPYLCVCVCVCVCLRECVKLCICLCAVCVCVSLDVCVSLGVCVCVYVCVCSSGLIISSYCYFTLTSLCVCVCGGKTRCEYHCAEKKIENYVLPFIIILIIICLTLNQWKLDSLCNCSFLEVESRRYPIISVKSDRRYQVCRILAKF